MRSTKIIALFWLLAWHQTSQATEALVFAVKGEVIESRGEHFSRRIGKQTYVLEQTNLKIPRGGFLGLVIPGWGVLLAMENTAFDFSEDGLCSVRLRVGAVRIVRWKNASLARCTLHVPGSEPLNLSLPLLDWAVTSPWKKTDSRIDFYSSPDPKQFKTQSASVSFARLSRGVSAEGKFLIAPEVWLRSLESADIGIPIPLAIMDRERLSKIQKAAKRESAESELNDLMTDTQLFQEPFK